MAQSLITKFKGLYTHPNDLSSVPEGALAVADNVVINREDVVEPRRGFDLLRHDTSTLSGFSDSAFRANKLFFFKNKVLSHYSTSKLAYHDSTTGWTALSGDYTPPSGVKLRAGESNQNFYYTTSDGVYKLDTYNATPIKAGAPRALDIQASLDGSSGFLEVNHRVAYRVLWGRKDVNSNLTLGAPSQAESIKNTSDGTRNIAITFTIPERITTDWFYQVYRTTAVDNSSSDFEPPEEFGLIYEGTPDSTDITNRYVSFTDITPDELRGENLYTNINSGEGIAAGNLEPPLCKDIAVFDDTTFYLNTISKHRYYLNLLAIGGSNGLQIDDILTIGGITYTAKAVENIISAQFRAYVPVSFSFIDTDVNAGTDVVTETAHGLQDGDPVVLDNTGGALPAPLVEGDVYYVVNATANTFQLAASLGGTAIDLTDAGTGTHSITINRSPTQNIRETTLSLIRVINRHTASTVVATYLSGPDDLPGKLLLEEEDIGGSSFALTSDNTTCWSPALPSSGTSESSTNDERKNGVSFSKPLLPEAVPLTNTRYAGSKDKAILRAVPLRDKLILFKEDGTFIVNKFTFEVEVLDPTCILIAPESVAVLNNVIFCLTTLGVSSVSDNGVQFMSGPINNTLIELQGINPDTLRDESFGIGYDSDWKYILFVPTAMGETKPTQAFVFNLYTNSWTRWPISRTCGGVNPVDDKLYLGQADSHYIDVERKSYSFRDHTDFGFTTTISDITGNTLTLGQVDQIDIGDIIYQSSTVYSSVTAVDPVAGTIEIESSSNFTTGAVDIEKAISTSVKWVPITLGNPGIMKQFYEISLLFSQPFSGEATVAFSSDLSPSDESETIEGSSSGGWGKFKWGQAPWGGGSSRKPFRLLVPQDKQRATQLSIEFSHSVGYARWSLNGLSIQANPGSSKVWA